MTDQCEHGSLARSCPLCEANAEIAALRAEVERLRGHLQDSVRAETSGRQLTVREIDGWWEISIPITIQRITVIPHWPCEAEILSDYVPPGTPKWFVPNAMELAERWRAAFSDGGAA